MSNAENLYAFGRVRVLETALMTADKRNSLLDAADAEAMLTSLLDMGYGAGLRVEHPHEYEFLINNDLKVAYKLVKELFSDQLISDLFFLHIDYQNIKVLLKCKLLNKEPDESLAHFGTISIDTLKEAVFDSKLDENLPEEVIALLEKFKEGKYDESDIGNLVDQALYAQIARGLKNVKDKSIKQYFNVQAEYYNVISLFRAKALEDLSALENSYLDLGKIELDDLKQAFEMSNEEAVEFITEKQQLDDGIEKGLKYFLTSGSLSVLEKNRDNYFIKLFKPLSIDPISFAPTIGYLLAKEQQAKIVRLIMIAKINSLPKNLIEERLRDLYE